MKELIREDKDQPLSQKLSFIYDSIKLEDANYREALSVVADSIIHDYEFRFPDDLPIDSMVKSAVVDALDQVIKLRDEAKERSYDPAIESVIIFSGGGTYDEKLLEGQPEWFRWGDHDRIQAGIAVAYDVTRAKISQNESDKTRKDLSIQELEEFGPIIVYPGNPIENSGFRDAIKNGSIKYPEKKILIVDEVDSGKGIVPIAHTGHQMKALFDIAGKSSRPLGTNIATVQHIPDYVRLPFYLHKEVRIRKEESLKFYAFALQSRRGSSQGLREDTIGGHLINEFDRLIRYVKRGDLDPTPIQFANVP